MSALDLQNKLGIRIVPVKFTIAEYAAIAEKAGAVGEMGIAVPIGRLVRAACLRALAIPETPRGRRRRVAG